ncbi:MAG TPA: acyl-CoA thioesterase [Candidatus Omnitrophica bacterium]|nr:acyl-CoA thioesterase [Candidatus Omnitrophota bacterium]
MLKKTVADSTAILSEVMMPLHANHYGSVHGGTILKLVDEAAFVAATKHARKNVVVASMDNIEFKHPVGVGDVLTLRASVYHVGRTSMDVEVEIETEKIKQGKILKVGSAYLTMVAMDKKGKPAEVPRLILKTKEEVEKNKQIKLKRRERLARFSRNYK